MYKVYFFGDPYKQFNSVEEVRNFLIELKEGEAMYFSVVQETRGDLWLLGSGI